MSTKSDSEKASAIGSAMAARRWVLMTAEERTATAGAGGRKAWAGLSAEERSAEMKRRAKLRPKRAKKATIKKPRKSRAKKTAA